MNKYIYTLLIALLSSLTTVWGQTEDYARLASESFTNGAYSQALVYCSMYAAEHSERLPIEKNVKLCLEYEKQFNEAAMNKNVPLAKVFCDRITGLNPRDKRIKDRLSALEAQVKSSAPQQSVDLARTPKAPRKQFPLKPECNHFNFEATIYKDLEVSFSMNLSYLFLGINYGYDMWKSQRILTEPAPMYANEYAPWTHTEVVRPMHLMVFGGLFFKYFAIDCGVGYVFANTRTATYKGKNYAEKEGWHEHSDEKRVAFFTFRPEVKVFIPFRNYGKDRHWIFSFGYNFVNKANCTEGITISTGCGWSF